MIHSLLLFELADFECDTFKLAVVYHLLIGQSFLGKTEFGFKLIYLFFLIERQFFQLAHLLFMFTFDCPLLVS